MSDLKLVLQDQPKQITHYLTIHDINNTLFGLLCGMLFPLHMFGFEHLTLQSTNIIMKGQM